MIKSRTFIAVPPGETIKEQLEERGMTQKEFACRMDLSEKHISKLLNGEVHLTPEVAERLEMVLGVPSRFWNNLEAIYREMEAKANEENALAEDIETTKLYPYKKMADNGWVPETTKPEERAKNLRKYFEVSRLCLLKGNLIPGVACRRFSQKEAADYALIAWAQRAKLIARDVPTKPINISKLIKRIPQIRSMTNMEPEIFSDKLREIMADCGVALVFLPHLGGSFLHGATFLDGKKYVVGLTVRGRDADRFWFSLFHELFHVIEGHATKPEGTSEEDERAADAFAANTLIPIQELESFVQKRDFTKASVLQFAETIGVAPGIVVGRLQKDSYISFSWFNELKKKYCIV